MHAAHLILFFAILLSSVLRAQPVNLGLPPVTNYTRSDYRAGTQNWDAAQDARGLLFFANNEGLLQFDGTYWSLYPIANGTCVRAVCIGSDGRIYVGGQGELGYFQPDGQGRLGYRSLCALLAPSDRRFEDVWDIVADSAGAVWFRTDDFLLRYQDQRLHTYRLGRTISFMGLAGRALWVQDDAGQLHRWNGTRFENSRIAGTAGSIITAMLPWENDTILVAYLKHGIYALAGNSLQPWKTPADAFLKEKRIYHAALLPDRRIALASSLGGLVVLGADRRPLLHIRKNNGLQNNNVLAVCCDASGNLWLGLDNGIDLVEINAPFYRILPDADLEGAAYAACVYENRLYLGTSNGLYSKPWQPYYDPFQDRGFELVRGSTGQVWGLDIADNTLFMGHHEGAFRVKGEQAGNLATAGGTWRYVQLNDTILIAGGYAGLAVFQRKKGGPWQYRYPLKGLDESCRIMELADDGVLWVSHPYRGVFKVTYQHPKDTVRTRLYGRADGLPSDLLNYVFKLGKQIVVAADGGLFHYDKASDRFVHAAELEKWLDPAVRTRLLRADWHGNIWFAHGEDVGVLWVRDEGVRKQVRKQVFPELNGQLVGGFEQIQMVDDRHVMVATQKGFVHLDLRQLAGLDTQLRVAISSVRLNEHGDSLLYGGFPTDPPYRPVLPYQLNSLRFAFGALPVGGGRPVLYSVLLEGLDKNWSVWSEQTLLDYAHLPAGDYTFKVRARNSAGVESPIAAFRFRIRPPWYAGFWAYCVYALAVIAGISALFFRQQRKFESEKAELASEHLQESTAQRRRMQQHEQEIVRLQNEKLESEVQHKNKELALATMHLVQKGEILTSLQEELDKILQKKLDGSELRQELQRILRLLQYDAQIADDWEQFAYHFDAVYGDFLKRLRDKFPELSPNDYRLCAYLRMNLSTKEIAHLMNISIRGVEGARYRLRKKLNLPNEDNLVAFLMET